MRESRRAGGRSLSRHDVAVQIGEPILRKSRPEQFKTAGDSRKQVIEVVRESAGEVTHSLHVLGREELFLGPLQLQLRFPPLGEVPSYLRETNKLVGFVMDGIDDSAGPESRAVLPTPPSLGLISPFPPSTLACPPRQAGLPILGRVEQRKVLAEDFRLGVALDTRGSSVPVGHMAIRVKHIDGVIRGPLNE